ncbi:hypothetical protein PILCRDRAFT_811077 [Piloderma croceum F 1598]|uniref:Uncharacterized protein n=1 Tax=Piloderma croceum (strain F 1598) TaxID=765440 RepID=A0A0C3CLV6_PILCF|nr:hypothetical protein PILCRDRAFT_811077 [Piloderma croceum F 1598]
MIQEAASLQTSTIAKGGIRRSVNRAQEIAVQRQYIMSTGQVAVWQVGCQPTEAQCVEYPGARR